MLSAELAEEEEESSESSSTSLEEGMIKERSKVIDDNEIPIRSVDN